MLLGNDNIDFHSILAIALSVNNRIKTRIFFIISYLQLFHVQMDYLSVQIILH